MFNGTVSRDSLSLGLIKHDIININMIYTYIIYIYIYIYVYI